MATKAKQSVGDELAIPRSDSALLDYLQEHVYGGIGGWIIFYNERSQTIADMLPSGGSETMPTGDIRRDIELMIAADAVIASLDSDRKDTE